MISKFSVKKPYTVLVGVILAIVLGVVSFTRMTTDLLPNISLPYVLIMTTYAGANPETVEMVVTQPIEASMATVSNIEGVSSVSAENYSMVILEFAQSADMNAASLEIRESLDQIKSYWDDSVSNPIIIKMNPDMLPVMIAAVGVEGMDNGDISTYVQDEIMPELESIEGVASVSATGLLEESVNVIIRKDKVDAINEKIFAAIDDEMKEAEEELADGREELEDGKKEIADSWKELNDGKKELADSKQELIDGKQELEDGQKELDEGKDKLASGKGDLQVAQKETAAKLASTKKELLTAKADLEATKMQMTTTLTTAQQLDGSVKEIDMILGASGNYSTAYTKYAALLSVSSGDSASIAAAKAEIESLKSAFVGSTVMNQMAAANDSMSTMLATLKQMDWTAVDNVNFGTVYAMLSAVNNEDVIKQRNTLQNAVDAQTNGLGYEGYAKVAQGAIATIDENLKKVDQGLIEVEKGQLTAAIELANAAAQINLGEYQMELGQTQLDAAKEQMEAGEEQIKEAEEQMKDAADQLKDAEQQLLDAEDQLLDGEEQLEDARKDAYRQADMNKILSVDTIKSLLTAQNFAMPAGYVTEDGVDYMVRVGDKPSTVEEMKALPLMDMHMDGVPVITLGDVADVFYTDNSGEVYTNVDGNPGIMLTIQKQTGYSTGEVSDLLNEEFEKLAQENTKLSIIPLMDQGIFIDLVMDSIINNILFGGLLAVLILIVFLKDLKPTFVIACSIPISLVTAIVCMYFSGVTLNVISLSGLALGIGMLVDNSIVVIENIYRLRSEGYSMKDAAVEGAKEVAGAIMASTLTTICVFLPIVFTEGITRQLFVDMGLTIAYSLLASLVIALTVVPAMASKVLTKTKEQKEGRFFGGLISLYKVVLELALKVKPLVYLIVIILLVVSISVATTNGIAFMSEMDSTQLTVTVSLDEDATLQETAELTDKVVTAILEIEDIQNVGAMSATDSMAMLSGGSGSDNATTIYVLAKEDKTMSNEEIAEIIREKTADLPAEISIETSSMDMSALGGSGISIQVRGRDLDTLRSIAGEVAAVVESVEGTAQVSDGMEESNVELRILVDRDKAVNYGLTVAQVFTQVSAKLAEASSATTLVAADKDYNVYVMNGSDIELTRELVKEINIDGTDEEGKSVDIPLSELATFEDTYALSAINRADQNRYVAVSAAIAEGYNVGNVAAEVEARLADYELPEGYRLIFSGENEMIMDAMEQVGLMLLLALVFMYLIMVAQFQSLLSPFIIMFTIPLAFTGGFFGLFISGSEISVIALIGFVMLSGIIVNNGIVLIDYINQLRENGMEKHEAIMDAGRTRLRPVLMTALTTILALGTMVFSNDMGSEMAKPMSVVTIGGLVYGTLLTLIVIPCVYDSFTGSGKKRKEEEDEFANL
ncbi:MAG: efflux RND transporter permease subunit [Lachnospiraceae bacterium]|nr:efflux RND transporter permease subunit [Lachnospiraceae bacterium]